VTALLDQLDSLLGPGAIVPADVLAERATSYWNSAPTRALAMVRPASTEQLSQVMRLCSERGQTMVVQGGRTGVVAGAEASASDLIISLERMSAIEAVDDVGGTATIQGGAVLQTVQEQLAEQGFLFPLDLGARGSCTIGGTVATNAGGINVLRYGMMRNLVLGLEAVLADGTVVSSMNQMLKNNTGYDLKQLFIGSEGTLGVVTRAVVRLYPLPGSRQTALVALPSFDAVIQLLKTAQSDLAGTLSAYEIMWNSYYRAVTVTGAHRAPMDRDYAFYVMIEAEGADPEADELRFERMLEQAFDGGVVVDAVIPKSDTERRALWNVREEFDAILPSFLYDVSLPIRDMPAYVDQLHIDLRARWPEVEFHVFGHMADGNLHLFVNPQQDGATHADCDAIVYRRLPDFGGSVSAEHGIGLDKRDWLPTSRSAQEISLMRMLKGAFDPQGLLNPGRII
jgi:FAD/FMN-containing dehydrogenase